MLPSDIFFSKKEKKKILINLGRITHVFNIYFFVKFKKYIFTYGSGSNLITGDLMIGPKHLRLYLRLVLNPTV